jgi:PAS domain S-box-containing protein
MNTISQHLLSELSGLLHSAEANNHDIKADDAKIIFNKLKNHIAEIERQNLDLSARVQKIERESGSTRSCIGCLAKPTVLLDPKGSIKQVNKLFSKFTERPENELVGKNLFTDFFENGHTILDSIISPSASDDETLVVDGAFRKTDSKNISVRITKFNSINNTPDYLESIQNPDLLLHLDDLSEFMLKRNSNLLDIIDIVQDAIIITDKNFVVQRWNKSAEEVYGWSEPEILGRSMVNMVHTEYISEKPEEVLESFMKNGFWSGEVMQTGKDGRKIPIFASIAMRRNEKGEYVGAVAINRDITNLKKANEQQLKLTRAIEHSPASIVITNVDGDIEYVNPKFTEVTGYSFSEVLGKNPRILKSNQMSPKVYKELWAEVLSGNEWRGEMLNRKKNGDLYWEFASISAQKDANGIITHFIAVKEDVTQRKKFEAELEEKNRKLQETNATKDKFFSIIAHDLKNPFGVILGFSDFLLSRFDKLDKEKIRQFVTNINKSSKETYKLLENLLEWSRLQRGLIVPEINKINLKNIVDEVCLLFNDVAQNKNISIINQIYSDLFARCDIEMTKTILRNLISNAIKFSNNQGVITISYDENPSEVLLKIADNGVGIPESQISKLFKIDSNISTTGTANERGTGLGLILCKELIEKQGGRIFLESTVNLGTTFYCALVK